MTDSLVHSPFKADLSALTLPHQGTGAAATVSHVVFTLLLCVIMTVFPIAAFFVHPALAIAAQFVLATMLVLYLTPLVPPVILFSILFQNVFISLFSGYVVDSESLNILKGFNFLTTMICWIWLFGHYAMHWREYSRQVNRVMAVGLIAFALIAFYLLLGMAKNPMGAVIYLRNVITPMVMFQIFFLVALRSSKPLLPFFIAIVIILSIAGWIEALDRKLWLDLTNGWTYWGIGARSEMLDLLWDKGVAKDGKVITGIIDTMKVDFLNTPLMGTNRFVILRLNGPNIHAISLSYALIFLILVMSFSGRWYLALPLLPLTLLASAKGALIMLFLACCALIARKMFGAVFAFVSLCVVLVIYIVVGVIVGLKIGDFHVLGFMGGVYNFLEFPFGRGLGDGGNLAIKFETLDWSAYQHAGRTPIAMESAVGVMLHQLGIATFGLIACYVWIAYQTFKLSLSSRIALHSIASFTLLIIVVNGIFQEEALFSPLALGLIMALNGQILGTGLRKGSHSNP